jgi:hypothetical protein
MENHRFSAAKDRCGFGGGAKGRRDFQSLYDLLERDYDDIELLEREPIFGKCVLVHTFPQSESL